ncbi:hypothetical protein PBAL39_15229 [Pedobacter sp. BAL39]|uniref:hypothetical protein n=1 Tax=Pedobacter sp. BAL39 TaxID=391596 RepID=UPI0001559BA6|nr:hypothetical protein [Pedobacter sp. BAL39]EDM37789.1 hypothetical protein PBAL39_15229 [Pedobacter sp. BAL39]
MIFLSISVIQAIHSHEQTVQTEQSTADQDATTDMDHCKICDYIIHKQSKHLFLEASQLLAAPLPEPISFCTHYFLGNYKFTLQDFTNKGPPALLA